MWGERGVTRGQGFFFEMIYKYSRASQRYTRGPISLAHFVPSSTMWPFKVTQKLFTRSHPLRVIHVFTHSCFTLFFHYFCFSPEQSYHIIPPFSTPWTELFIFPCYCLFSFCRSYPSLPQHCTLMHMHTIE